MMRLVPGWWCQERQFGWVDGSPEACTVRGHHHVRSHRNPEQPEHSVTHDWLMEDWRSRRAEVPA